VARKSSINNRAIISRQYGGRIDRRRRVARKVMRSREEIARPKVKSAIFSDGGRYSLEKKRDERNQRPSEMIPK
jgi:hypothetical protein